MDVVCVLTGRIATSAVRTPARGGQPDLAVPDHVQHTQPVRVVDEERREAVAVRPVGVVRVAAEPARSGREVARAPLRMLTTVVVAAPAGVVVVEPGLDRLVARVRGAGGDAPAGGLLIHVAALAGQSAVVVA